MACSRVVPYFYMEPIPILHEKQKEAMSHFSETFEESKDWGWSRRLATDGRTYL
uniref:Uncharacterized protein n=1 Tax=Picea glauca TaxID=3330 RepID=A0A117NID9_PICGL|nr:hypothetical protein ABT39_MTgene3034 [Picea glauca]